MKSGIYKIINLANGKFYIGSAIDLNHRWKTHIWLLERQKHRNKYLQSAWNLYGSECFNFEIIETCCKEFLLVREQFYIDITNCCDRNIGYNLYKIAGSPQGHSRSEAVKEKQRLAMTGFKHTEASIEKMRKIHSNRSLETKLKLSKSKMGHKVSAETRAKIGLANKGKRRINIDLKSENQVFL